MAKKKMSENQIVVYQAKSGALALRKDIHKATIWATQAEMAKVFDVTSQNITLHLRNIFKDSELDERSTCKEYLQVQKEGGREIKRKVKIYNLDAMIAVGYRINSVVGTKFRQWATKTLRQYIVDGYAINRNRIAANYGQFLEAVERVKQLLPTGAAIDTQSVLELVNAFADTWLSLDAYDKGTLFAKGTTKKRVALTAEKLKKNLATFKTALAERDKTPSQKYPSPRYRLDSGMPRNKAGGVPERYDEAAMTQAYPNPAISLRVPPAFPKVCVATAKP
jgi:hypothetical protein